MVINDDMAIATNVDIILSATVAHLGIDPKIPGAIKEYLNKRGWKTGKVSFDVGNRLVGYYCHEYEETYFSGATVQVSKSKE